MEYLPCSLSLSLSLSLSVSLNESLAVLADYGLIKVAEDGWGSLNTPNKEHVLALICETLSPHGVK